MVGPDEPRASGRPALAPIALVAALVVAAAGIVIALGATAMAPPAPAPSPSVGPAEPSPGGDRSPAASDGSAAASRPPAAAVALTGAAPGVGAIVAVDAAGAVTMIGAGGHATLVGDPGEAAIGFPAWSPDGTRIAAVIGHDTTSTVEVFPVDPGAGTVGAAIPLYSSSIEGAFYVAWTPSGGAVSFLANDADIVDLRVVATDRASPVDETDAASLIRRGAPLYFDWLDDDQLLAHVGVGEGAFLGLLGKDGHEAGGRLPSPGDFRAAQASPDGRFVGYVRVRAGGAPGAEDVVLAAPDGSGESTLPVFGPAAVTFSPAADVLAAIGADVPGQPDLAFPIGPLRTIDAATGVSRTLLDGAVVAGFWSPDGRTIFALRLQVPSGTSADAAGPGVAAGSPSPAPSEVHALFVDVASGEIHADHVIRPGGRFVSEVLPYFDQYELSHRLWAPDSSSFLLPVVADDGTQAVIALPRDGGPSPFQLAAPAAFWSR